MLETTQPLRDEDISKTDERRLAVGSFSSVGREVYHTISVPGLITKLEKLYQSSAGMTAAISTNDWNNVVSFSQQSRATGRTMTPHLVKSWSRPSFVTDR